MPQPCKVCNHPEATKINDDLIRRVPLTVIEKRYDISRHSLKRHKKAHLNQDIIQWRKRLFNKTGESVKSTLEYYDTYLEQLGEDPEIIAGATFSHVLKILESRSMLLGERGQPTKIEIRWGAGLFFPTKEEEEEPSFTIKVPAVKSEKEET